MKLILALIIMNIAVMQELQIEGDLTVSGDINSAVIDSLQDQITILNSVIDSLLAIQSVSVLEFVEFDMQILESPSGQSSEYQYIDISDLTSELGEFNRISILGIDYNGFVELFHSLIFECSDGPEKCIGGPATFEQTVAWGVPSFMLNGETQLLKYHSTVSVVGYVTIYVLIEKF